MKRSRFLTLLSLVALTFTLTVGCNQPNVSQPDATTPSPEASAAPVELTVSAAASLQDALLDVQSLYTQKQPNVTITYNFGSSGSLQQQIEQGAPTDVFLSAAPKQMDALQEQGLLLNETRQDLLKNQMVLIVPANGGSLSGFQDLTADSVQRIAMGEPESVPAGKYAQEVLTSLGLWQAVQPKLVLAKDVRQVLSYVETGNVDAGLVYVTDVKGADGVTVAAMAPEEAHTPIIYPVAVLKESQKVPEATAFVEFLSTPEATAAFEQFGFTIAD